MDLEGGGFDLALYARVLKRRGPLLFIPLVMLTVILGAGSLMLKNIYGVEASVVVRQEADTAEGLAVKTQITQQLGGVVQELRQASVQKAIYDQVRRAKPGLTLQDALLAWQGNLKIESTQKEKDLIVTFSYKDGPAAYAVAVVNAFADAFVKRGNQLVSGALDVSVEFVGEQLESQRKRLADLEEQQRRLEKRLTGDLGEFAASTGDESLAKTLSSRLGDNQTKLDTLDGTLASQQAQAAYLRAELAKTPPTLEAKAGEAPSADSVIGTLARMLLEAKTRKVQLQSRYTAHHPEVEATNEQIRDLEQRLAQAKRSGETAAAAPNPNYDSLKRELVTLEGQLRANQAQRAQLAGSSDRLRRAQVNLPQSERELTRIAAEAKAVRTTYETLLQRQQSLDLNKNFEEGRNVSRFDLRAATTVPPPLKVWPKRGKYLMMGFVGGLFIGLGFVLLAEYLDHSIRSNSDLRRWLDAPVLAVLPRAPR